MLYSSAISWQAISAPRHGWKGPDMPVPLAVCYIAGVIYHFHVLNSTGTLLYISSRTSKGVIWQSCYILHV